MNKGKIKIVIAMLIWGSVGVFARFSGLSGLGVAFARVSLGSIFLLIILGAKRRIREALDCIARNPLPYIGIGSALALNWIFFFTGLEYTTIANVVLVYYTSPIIATLLSWKFLKEKVKKSRMFAISLAFLGLGIIISGQEISINNRDFIGIMFALIAAFFYALIPNLGRFLKKVKGEILTFLQLLVASFLMLPIISVVDVGKPVWWSIGVLVTVHTVLALFLYMEGLKEVSVSEAALLSYLDPISAVIYGIIIFGEVPSIYTIIGGGLILIATALDALKKG